MENQSNKSHYPLFLLYPLLESTLQQIVASNPFCKKDKVHPQSSILATLSYYAMLKKPYQ